MSTSVSSSSSQSPTQVGPNLRSNKRRIGQLSGALPSTKESRKSTEKKANEAVLSHIKTCSEQLLEWADSQRNRRTVADYSYVVSYDVDNSIKDITLPNDFHNHNNEIDKLIAFLIRVGEVNVLVEPAKVPKTQIDVPDIIKKYIAGVVLAITGEAELPHQWKQKNDPTDIARQAVLWKRMIAWLDIEDIKTTHPFAFAHASVTGTGEKAAFSSFFSSLAKVEGHYAVQQAKAIKILISHACNSRAMDCRAVLDSHRISRAELNRNAKPRTLDTSKAKRRGAQKIYIVKPLWDPETFPFLTRTEKLLIKARKESCMQEINESAGAFEKLNGLKQYEHWGYYLKKQKTLYQKLYQEVDRISTSLHRRRISFETYLSHTKIATVKGTKLEKSTVSHFEKEVQNPTKVAAFALVMDPRNVLPTSLGHLVANRDALANVEGPIGKAAQALISEFFEKYPDYTTTAYVDNVEMCRNTNIFEKLYIDDDKESNDSDMAI
jgi:ribosomal protein L20A (L18A)